MKKDGLLTGLILGGLLGVTVSLLAVNAVKTAGAKSEKNDENNKQGSIKLKTLAENKKENQDTTAVDENNSQMDDNALNGSIGSPGKDDTGNREDMPSNQTSEETTEKPENKQKEMRNTEEEDQKKAEQEGISITEDIASKLNFGKKITQLEESLRKLREENT